MGHDSRCGCHVNWYNPFDGNMGKDAQRMGHHVWFFVVGLLFWRWRRISHDKYAGNGGKQGTEFEHRRQITSRTQRCSRFHDARMGTTRQPRYPYPLSARFSRRWKPSVRRTRYPIDVSHLICLHRHYHSLAHLSPCLQAPICGSAAPPFEAKIKCYRLRQTLPSTCRYSLLASTSRDGGHLVLQRLYVLRYPPLFPS